MSLKMTPNQVHAFEADRLFTFAFDAAILLSGRSDLRETEASRGEPPRFGRMPLNISSSTL